MGLIAIVIASTANAEPSKATQESIVDDASGLASLLAGGEPDPPRKQLDHALPAAAPAGIHVGHDDVGFRGDVSMHASTYEGLPLALAAIRATNAQHHEDDLGRTQLEPTKQSQPGKLKLDSREMRELSRCYRKALAFDPGTSNEVDLSFAIDRKGKVVAPMAVSDNGELDSCLNGVMARWKFPGKASGKNRIWLSVVLTPR